MTMLGQGRALRPPYREVMIFIDGGYLRACLRKRFGSDKFSLTGLQDLLEFLTGIVYIHARPPSVTAELIRAYYYDAIVQESEGEKREKQELFFNDISLLPFCTVRLGRQIKTNEGYRQKGVDILMAIDMLAKAYENHYEIAILVAGDGDFVDLVKAVKDTGKRVYGAYFENSMSADLKRSFDLCLALPKNTEMSFR